MKREIPSPYFHIDVDALQADFDMLIHSLEQEWNNYTIGYSFKTNSLPWLVTFLKQQGVLAEVVSDDEYGLAKYLGFADRDIIYNGPVKKRPSFEAVLLAGGIVNLDAAQELEWLRQISKDHPNQTFQVGVRVNFDLEKMCTGETTMGAAGGRFGFCYETGVFAEVLETIQSMPNVEVAGLHLHSSSKSRSLHVFESIAEMACRLKREYDLHLKYVDMGGGYCGGMPNRPQYKDYCPVIAKALSQEFKPEETTLIMEPGISLISKATTFVTEVIDVRDIKGTRYLITDGSRFNIDTTMIKSSYMYHVDYNGGEETRSVWERQIVSGFTCMECDRLFEIENGKELQAGDRIVYENVGGYTMSLNPLFIQYFPSVYTEKDGVLTEVRKRWTAQEYVQNCIW